MATLLFNFSGSNPFDVQLQEDVYAVGRETSNNILIPDPSVSAHHARLKPGPDGWYVEDLNSSNGTYVNQRRVSYAKLTNGDIIRFGNVDTEFLDDEFTFTATSRSFLGGVKAWNGVATWSSIQFTQKKSGEVIEIPFKSAPQAIKVNRMGTQITVKQADGRDIKLLVHPERWVAAVEDVQWQEMVTPWAGKILDAARQHRETRHYGTASVISLVSALVVILPLVCALFPGYSTAFRFSLTAALGAALERALQKHFARKSGAAL